MNMETKTLNQLRDKIHATAVKHGFYDDEINAFAKACNLDIGAEAIKHAFFAQKIALIHSELSEALEADRMDVIETPNGILQSISTKNNADFPILYRKFVKSTRSEELADVIIRILDLCGHTGIDIEKHIELKMRYNELREYKYGKKY
jgi:NTP pyrophosphatase (non-canonical NTP hydrolase)